MLLPFGWLFAGGTPWNWWLWKQGMHLRDAEKFIQCWDVSRNFGQEQLWMLFVVCFFSKVLMLSDNSQVGKVASGSQGTHRLQRIHLWKKNEKGTNHRQPNKATEKKEVAGACQGFSVSPKMRSWRFRFYLRCDYWVGHHHQWSVYMGYSTPPWIRFLERRMLFLI